MLAVDKKFEGIKKEKVKKYLPSLSIFVYFSFLIPLKSCYQQHACIDYVRATTFFEPTCIYNQGFNRETVQIFLAC